jgi:hypothetical protein
MPSISVIAVLITLTGLAFDDSAWIFKPDSDSSCLFQVTFTI